MTWVRPVGIFIYSLFLSTFIGSLPTISKAENFPEILSSGKSRDTTHCTSLFSLFLTVKKSSPTSPKRSIRIDPTFASGPGNRLPACSGNLFNNGNIFFKKRTAIFYFFVILPIWIIGSIHTEK